MPCLPPSQKRMSVVEITKAERYCNGEPVAGGLYDLKLGVTDFNTRCDSCGNTYRGSNRVNDCPGHFGHIEARPRLHPFVCVPVHCWCCAARGPGIGGGAPRLVFGKPAAIVSNVAMAPSSPRRAGPLFLSIP